MGNLPGSGSLSRRQLLVGGSGTALTGLSGCFVRGESSDLSGEIHIDGSNTVLPHSAIVAEEFQWRNNRVIISVRGSGTGAGFQRFCTGETAAQNASRVIQVDDDEGELCRANDIEYIELEVALDGIAVFTHPENTWCDELTLEELERIWEPGSTVQTWADVRPGADWPDEEIDFYGRDPASGTFDFFTKAINGEVGAIRSDYSASADTNVIVRGVRGTQYGLGFGGAGYYEENEDDLKLIAVESDEEPGTFYRPSPDNIETGVYSPLTRPLYLYFNVESLERLEMQRFAEFYFDPIDDEAAEADFVDDESMTWTQWAARQSGFYALDDDRLSQGRERLQAALEEGTA
ncbi:PstS family phosphate ABC transporter substrate-binding protein [Halobacteria archaeon AArc-curdl1]|uniref:PstS family phosphate ABC transporter substrate-binding protein n=1 Tax=Natronosalvus hydrolyticus TaxID=2979988 RepID=A0AAP3E7I3_9EURY|nr:PstS family phosphate ABC transporter substrate-binding protein [Halobacteria archaeon AArc-curdl1]